MTCRNVMDETAGAVTEIARLGGRKIAGLRRCEFEQALELIRS